MKTLGMGVYWQEVSVGERFRTLRRTITETDIVNFVGVTGMLEVLFLDDTFADERGSIAGGARLAPAVLTYAIIEGFLCQSMIQGTGLAMLELHKKVLGPVRAGDTIHAEVEISGVKPTSKGNRAIVTSEITVLNQRAEKVMLYTAVRMLAGRPDAADSTHAKEV